jgi:hypothetical protein
VADIAHTLNVKPVGTRTRVAWISTMKDRLKTPRLVRLAPTALCALLAISLSVPVNAETPFGEENSAATTPEMCESMSAETEGIGWTGTRLVGYEWECPVVGSPYELSNGTAYILACSAEGIEIQRVVVVTSGEEPSTINLDISGYRLVQMTLCEH